MTRSKVYFRADADHKIGYGHFVRCLALADMLKNDFECVYYTQNPTEYQRQQVKEICQLRELPSDDRKFSLFLEELRGDEIVVLDNYFFTSEYEVLIRKKGCKVVSISPMKKDLEADAVVFYVDRDMSTYKLSEHTSVYAGLEWVILRQAFYKPTIKAKKNNKIVIAYGGTDQFCLTEKTMDVIPSFFDIHVICSDRIGTNRLKRMKKNGATCHINVDADTVASIFDEAEIAILSSSTVCHEALSRNCRVIAGYYIDNQELLYQSYTTNNYIIGIGNMLLESFPQDLIQALSDQRELTKIEFSSTKDNYIELFNSL